MEHKEGTTWMEHRPRSMVNLASYGRPRRAPVFLHAAYARPPVWAACCRGARLRSPPFLRRRARGPTRRLPARRAGWRAMPSGRRPSSARQSVRSKLKVLALGTLVEHRQASGARGNRAPAGRSQVGVRPAGKAAAQGIELMKLVKTKGNPTLHESGAAAAGGRFSSSARRASVSADGRARRSRARTVRQR